LEFLEYWILSCGVSEWALSLRLREPKASGHFDLLPDEQAELAAKDLLDDESRRDWARVVSNKVRGSFPARKGNGYAVCAGEGDR
jgi:hypothetical protein